MKITSTASILGTHDRIDDDEDDDDDDGGGVSSDRNIGCNNNNRG